MAYDFSGWATRFNVRCADGRTIKENAFDDCDGKTVPLVWDHKHESLSNVLGHALLEKRDDGIYAYCSFNNSDLGGNAKELVKHKDITSLSIYANHLKQRGGDVIHGAIREVSLVLAGANPEAYIDSVMVHSDNGDEDAIIYTTEGDSEIMYDDNFTHSGLEDNDDEIVLEHADGAAPAENSGGEDKTVGDVFNELTDEQKNVVYALIGMAVEEAKNGGNDAKEKGGNDTKEKEGDDAMKHNVFDNNKEDVEVLSHSDMEAIFSDVKRYGSMKEATLAHGIDNIEYLFPDEKNVASTPEWVKRDTGWVKKVMTGVHHTPFSRIKSMYADITEDDARALGYIKGNMKKEEFFGLARRSTTPTTIYKKQKLDRDDIIDITDFDVVAWLKGEMRGMLDEEIARAILVSDGRDASSDDKINEGNIRPIWTDSDIYTVKKKLTFTSADTDDTKAKAFIKAVIKAHKDYKGSGSPTLFTTEDILTNCLLMEDQMGRIIYDTEDKLRTALRVKEIVTVPVMENLTREVSGNTHSLLAIMVNLNDYNVGADKGGAVNMFDDFDIDYNAQKYLIETRCSGALIKPYSAVVFESVEE